MTISTHQEPKTNEPENHLELHEEEETISSSSSSSPQSNRSYKSPLSHRSYKSPQSNRSFQTPSPLPDTPADYSDHSQDDHGFQWIENKPANPPSLHPNRSFPAEPLVVTQALDPEAQEGFAGIGEVQEGGAGGGGSAGSFNRRKLRPDLSNRKTARKDNQNLVKKVLLGFRICGFAFCLISFSIMAANKNKGWALDSFYRYKELRYCLVVNVVGFGYSLLQVIDLIHFLAAEKHLVPHQFRHYFDFFMDQIISYLLMSASSSAATRVEDWESNWGKDKFPDMAHASVGLSFAAFVALAFSSIASGYLAFAPKSF